MKEVSVICIVSILVLFSCGAPSQSNSSTLMDSNSKPVSDNLKVPIDQLPVEKAEIVYAYIDTACNAEIEFSSPSELYTSFERYAHQDIDDPYVIWSELLFGQCCSAVDIDYLDVLDLKAECTHELSKYPCGQLADADFKTTFAFDTTMGTTITLVLDTEMVDTRELYITTMPMPNDTLMYPVQLRLVNGYVKSQTAYNENARIQKMIVSINDEDPVIVELLDSELVQSFSIDVPMYSGDFLSLCPVSYYPGTKYPEACLTELQTYMGTIGYKRMNHKYSVR